MIIGNNLPRKDPVSKLLELRTHARLLLLSIAPEVKVERAGDRRHPPYQLHFIPQQIRILLLPYRTALRAIV